MLAGIALAIAVVVATNAMVRVALRPLTGAGETLARLEAGDYAARARARGSAGDRRHRRSASTGSARRSAISPPTCAICWSAWLTRMTRSAAPSRASCTTRPARICSRCAPTPWRCAATVGDGEPAALARGIGETVQSLQKQNRRILANLRPAALDELGLVPALEALVEQWRRLAPERGDRTDAPTPDLVRSRARARG